MEKKVTLEQVRFAMNPEQHILVWARELARDVQVDDVPFGIPQRLREEFKSEDASHISANLLPFVVAFEDFIFEARQLVADWEPPSEDDDDGDTSADAHRLANKVFAIGIAQMVKTKFQQIVTNSAFEQIAHVAGRSRADAESLEEWAITQPSATTRAFLDARGLVHDMEEVVSGLYRDVKRIEPANIASVDDLFIEAKGEIASLLARWCLDHLPDGDPRAGAVAS